MLMGNHFGAIINSSGITGTARQGTCPNSASSTRVNTLARSAPPMRKTASRARVICGAAGSSPIAFSA